MSRHVSSLRFQLIAIVLLSVLPAMVLILYSAIHPVTEAKWLPRGFAAMLRLFSRTTHKPSPLDVTNRPEMASDQLCRPFT
jgi:hypothetical protein